MKTNAVFFSILLKFAILNSSQPLLCLKTVTQFEAVKGFTGSYDR